MRQTAFQKYPWACCCNLIVGWNKFSNLNSVNLNSVNLKWKMTIQNLFSWLDYVQKLRRRLIFCVFSFKVSIKTLAAPHFSFLIIYLFKIVELQVVNRWQFLKQINPKCKTIRLSFPTLNFQFNFSGFTSLNILTLLKKIYI